MSVYALERSQPAVRACAKAALSLRFTGHYLTLTGRKSRLFPAVSGRPDSRGLFTYDLARQKLPSEGPIPQGEYWIDFRALWRNEFWKRGSRPAWGNFRIAIHPYVHTQTHGRGGFFIHGGLRPGSAGCIDLSLRMDDLVHAIQEELAEEQPCYIPLSVRY